VAAYFTIADAVGLYGEDYVTVSADRDNDGEIDTALAEGMAEIVSAEADSYMMGRVPLPLENVPLDLKMHCIDIWIYRMSPDAATASIMKEKRFDAAIKWFEMVARGQIKLTYQGEPAVGANKVQSAYVVTANQALSDQLDGARRFSRKRLAGLL